MSCHRPAPSWSRAPQHVWSLDEIKQGHVITTHSINNATSNDSTSNDSCTVTFGRIADDPALVDITTAHESCSRLHARIAFDQRGTPWLRDLGSGNGTFVNNKRIPPEACGKEEEVSNQRKGSRGVVLYPGDAIRFGASTRIYLLEGPAEFEREAIKLKRKTMNENAAATKTQGSHDGGASPSIINGNGGCSWGMSEDAINTEQEQQSSAQVIDHNSNLPPLPPIESFFYSSKHKISDALHKLHSQYNAKLHKLHHIQTESKRIIQKENSTELTDGQRGQLTRNSDRIVSLEKEVANLKVRIENGMHLAIHGRARARSNKRPTEEDYGDDDVDDFYDRTTSTKRQCTDANDEAESEMSLIRKWKSLLEGHAKQHQVVSHAVQRCNALQHDIDNTSNKEEDEDTFFLQNDLSLANDNLAKATTTIEGTEKELDEVEYLLKIVNSKLRWERKEGWIGTEDNDTRRNKGVATKKEEIQPRCSTQQGNCLGDAVMERDSLMMPPPPSSSMMPPPPPVTVAPASSKPLTSVLLDEPTMPPTAPSKDEKFNCDAMPPTNYVGGSGTSATAKPQRKEKQKQRLGPMRPSPATVQGTLATLTQAASRPKPATPQPNGHGQKKMTTSDVSKPFDPRKDEWKAPVGQDGSGRTALHDKFKGRY